MGRVFRVLDRLTGRVITLKRLKAANAASDPATVAEDRLLLAREFRVLSSLRHPNIISVLDYGFDENREPFFTMDLEENARTILEAGRDAPFAVQVDLLVQTLRAVLYLHRHGIVHRDLKPENVLVVKQHVNVLDFGLASRRGAGGVEDTSFAGTLAYMAPEVLRGKPPTERCDLYAVGMIAYELLLGRYPFAQSKPLLLQREILETILPRATDEIDPRLRPILERLLAKQPEARYGDAAEVIAALASSLNQLLPLDTTTTRESFLQAAPLVGRDAELTTLSDVLGHAREGHGSAWLVGGESGVGKSRLLDEVRTCALVDGVVVIRGQTKSQGGALYHVWHEVITALVLRTEPSDALAGVLKAVVPEIGTLLGREIVDAPILDADAEQSRFLYVMEELLRLQTEPVLIVLEDLQWAGSESLRLWSWLAAAAGGLRVTLLGSFRNDEAPTLAEGLTDTRVLTLRRLDARETTALAKCMIGSASRRPELIEWLARETEGIPFFLVEVVRALAESAGGLESIGGGGLPEHVLSGGMQRVIRRRLREVPADALAPLETAAVIGRSIAADLMQVIHPGLDVDGWATRCAAPAVLELRDQQWRFAHDKLLEQLLQDLAPARRRTLHRQVAEAIETTPSRADEVMSLAHHWREAGEPAREAHYAERAGMLALQRGACREAIGFLGRALELVGEGALHHVSSTPATVSRRRWVLDPNARIDPDGIAFRLATIGAALTEAYYLVGDVRHSREEAVRALAHVGEDIPRSWFAWRAGVLQAGMLRGVQAISRVSAKDAASTRRVATQLGRVYLRLAEGYFSGMEAWPLLWSTLRFVNHCAPAGPSPELALSHAIGAMLAEAVPARALSQAWCRRAVEIVERTGTPPDQAHILARVAIPHLGACRWDEAESAIRRAWRTAESVMYMRIVCECHSLAGIMAQLRGDFRTALTLYRDLHRLCVVVGDRQITCWSLMGQAHALVRLGEHREAVELSERALAGLDEEAMRSEAILGLGMLALARLQAGDGTGAYAAADRSLAHLRNTTPLIYYTQQPTAATAEVFLALLEEQGPGKALAVHARQACASLRRFARRYPVGRPYACLWDGLEAWLGGRQRRAMRLWHRAIVLAERHRMPYESARAHLEIGRHLPSADPARRPHLARAAELFEQLGCGTDLQRARAELAS